MPCYNAGEYIDKAVESILQQTYTNWELIIIDDGSTDTSLQIIEQYVHKDKRIKLIINNINKGVSVSRNIALKACSGEYVAFLDADDIARPKRLEKEVFFLDHNKEYGAVGGRAQILDLKGNVSDVTSGPFTWQDIQKSIFFRNPFINSSMMFRKCLLDEYHISFNEKLKMGEDYLFWIKMSECCKMQILKDIIVLYRVNASGLCRQWALEMNLRDKCSREHRYIYAVLWKSRNIDVSFCNINCLINALLRKRAENIFEVVHNIVNVIKYGLIICGYRYDKVIFQEMYKCIKTIYLDSRYQRRTYKRQFQAMRQSVHKYGNYPYPKYMVLPEKKIVYLEMPKVANCSIKASMLKEKFEDDYSVQNESLKYTVHKLTKRYDNYYKFTFVRNPFERVVSCYESKYHKDRRMVGKIVKELEYEYYLFGYIRKDRGFSNFLCRIALIPNAYKDHHFKPQYNIVYDKHGRKRVDYIGKYENLGQEYQKISQKFDLDDLAVYNKTDRKDYMDYYNMFTVYLAYFIYRKDIKYFGYEKEYKELLNYVKGKKKNE